MRPVPVCWKDFIEQCEILSSGRYPSEPKQLGKAPYGPQPPQMSSPVDKVDVIFDKTCNKQLRR